MGHFCKWSSLGRLDRSSCMGPKDVPGVVGIYAFVFSVDTTSSNIRELIRCWKLSDKFLVHSELDKWSEPVQRNTFQPCLSWARWYDRSSKRKKLQKFLLKDICSLNYWIKHSRNTAKLWQINPQILCSHQLKGIEYQVDVGIQHLPKEYTSISTSTICSRYWYKNFETLTGYSF